jgi:hypothetical protein
MRGGGPAIKHQRSADVVFSTVHVADSTQWCTPAEVYEALEAMLPESGGHRLELFATQRHPREGWLHATFT